MASILGFCLIFNPSIDFLPLKLRAIDILGLAALVVLPWRLLHKPVRASAIGTTCCVVLLAVVWFSRDILTGNENDRLIPLRWIVTLAYAFAFAGALRDGRARQVFLGACLGALALLAVLYLEGHGGGALVAEYHLRSNDAQEFFVNGNYRASGLYGHPNATAAVATLLVPIALFLVETCQSRIWTIGLAGIVAAIGSALTFTRSAFLVACVSAGIWVARRSLRRPRYVIAVALALAAIAAVGPPGGWGRWTPGESADTNLQERIETTHDSLMLLLGHPLGIGTHYADILASQGTGLRATHNAFIEIGLVGGIAVSLLILLSMLIVIAFRRPGWGFIAGHVGLLFLFEEHLNNQVFVAMALVCVITAMASIFAIKRSSTRGVHLDA